MFRIRANPPSGGPDEIRVHELKLRLVAASIKDRNGVSLHCSSVAEEKSVNLPMCGNSRNPLDPANFAFIDGLGASRRIALIADHHGFLKSGKNPGKKDSATVTMTTRWHQMPKPRHGHRDSSPSTGHTMRRPGVTAGRWMDRSRRSSGDNRNAFPVESDNIPMERKEMAEKRIGR